MQTQSLLASLVQAHPCLPQHVVLAVLGMSNVHVHTYTMVGRTWWTMSISSLPVAMPCTLKLLINKWLQVTMYKKRETTARKGGSRNQWEQEDCQCVCQVPEEWDLLWKHSLPALSSLWRMAEEHNTLTTMDRVLPGGTSSSWIKLATAISRFWQLHTWLKEPFSRGKLDTVSPMPSAWRMYAPLSASYTEVNAILFPGWIPGYKWGNIQILPSTITK